MTRARHFADPEGQIACDMKSSGARCRPNGYRRAVFDALIAGCPTWGIDVPVDGAPICGPGSAWPLTVSLLDPAAVPDGSETGRRHVTENAQSFDLVDHAFDGFSGTWHCRGENWVLWSDDGTRFAVTPGRHSRGDWVHVRFLLRHLIVAGLIARPGWHCAHAAAVTLASDPSEAVLIAGPYLSGKTVLAERLIADGIARAIVEDDCAVLDARWNLTGLMPQEDGIATAWEGALRAIVLLDASAVEAVRCLPEDVAEACSATQVSWPLSWVPGGTPRHAAPPPPKGIPCIRTPWRDADQAVAALTAFAALR